MGPGLRLACAGTTTHYIVDAGLGGIRLFCQTTGMSTDSGIAALARLIDEARRAVVFTGAGISTESGIRISAVPAASGRGWRR